MSKVYICTAIPYVNGNPHIGHAMDYLLSDAYARFRRKIGDEVRFQVGTDEHGNKVYSTAKKNNLPVEEYAAQNSQKFQDFVQKLNISYTDVIRTTDPEHVRRCQEIWQKLTPHIYAADYDGWYCEGCERFIMQKEYEEDGGVCPDHQKPYERLTEKNYYLRISDFKDEIREQIESDKMLILPEFRKQEMLRLLEDTPDISISRPKKQLSWGVPVPGDESQVMYVWLDALSNYITILGYPDQDISEFWPATAQFVGKDILRFHAITWSAILLGLDLPLPQTLVSHGHVLSNGQKMSKSLGNVIDPIEVVERHGLEAFRYYFSRHIDTFVDSDFTWEKYDEAYNNELANDLGNLVQRLATLCSKNEVRGVNPDELQLLEPEYITLMGNFEFSKAFDYTWSKIRSLNKDIDQSKPWELTKNGEVEKTQKILNELVVKLVHVAHLLEPFLPDTAANIYQIFGTENVIERPKTPLFPKN
jgi:methionyl-tRNA synthetase